MDQQTNLRARILAILSSAGPQTVSELVRILEASDPQPIHNIIARMHEAGAVSMWRDGKIHCGIVEHVAPDFPW